MEKLALDATADGLFWKHCKLWFWSFPSHLEPLFQNEPSWNKPFIKKSVWFAQKWTRRRNTFSYKWFHTKSRLRQKANRNGLRGPDQTIGKFQHLWHITTRLSATYCARSATLLQRVVTCYVLLVRKIKRKYIKYTILLVSYEFIYIYPTMSDCWYLNYFQREGAFSLNITLTFKSRSTWNTDRSVVETQVINWDLKVWQIKKKMNWLRSMSRLVYNRLQRFVLHVLKTERSI